ncbi:hypothetical protein KKC22_08375 [Myxococcota bacterium]|nr:hypothetical protein [Myxococcota bacterium]
MRLAICLENLNSTEGGSRFQACMAMPSGTSGLSITPAAEVRWKAARGPSAHLGTTDDGRLALFVDAGFHPMPVVKRGGRVLVCPEGRPVILIDQDEVDLSGARWRVHLHGLVEDAAPASSPFFVRTAAVLAGLALAAGCAGTRENPTLPEASTAAPDRGPDAPPPPVPPAAPENEAMEKGKKSSPPVEVRDLPPYKPVPYTGRSVHKEE